MAFAVVAGLVGTSGGPVGSSDWGGPPPKDSTIAAGPAGTFGSPDYCCAGWAPDPRNPGRSA